MTKKLQRGFTLVELMIVVAIIGILAAVAIPAFLNYMKKSKATEARLQLNAIGKDAKAYWVEHAQFPTAAGPITPTKGTSGCCAAGGPNNHCAAAASWTGAWSDLGFEIKEPTLFYYEFTGGLTTFKATATGDLDCNGVEEIYTLNGDSTGGSPAVNLTEPPANN